jgi:hypothetical protein
MTIEERAAEESGLASEYRNDPDLLAFYMRKLPQRGWAGARTATERRYCQLLYHAKYPFPEG